MQKCPRCSFPKENDGYSLCKDCREKSRNTSKQIRKKALSKGLCSRCNANKIEKGAKLCDECQKALREVKKKVLLVTYKNDKKEETIAIICNASVNKEDGLKRFFRKYGEKEVLKMQQINVL